jgi:ribose/xylose/arabinose/galactoside ABC-type transport system permease subunit/ABC-type multidrug transport system ATPase subunit
MSAEDKKPNYPRFMLVLDKLMEFKEVSILIPFLVLFLGVGFIHPRFFGPDNLYNIARQTSFLLPIAFMVTFVMVSNGIDISVGRLSALCGITCSLALIKGVPLPLAIIVGLATGAIIGVFNGWAITTFRIPPMIVTLGTMYITFGIGLVITAGNPLYPLPKSFLFLGQGNFLGLPVVVWVSVAIGIIAWIVLNKTPYGYWLCALGGNKEATRRAGLNVKLLEMSPYLLSGLASAIAGMLFAARVSVAKPDLGYSWEMQAIAAVVIGGTSLFGGIGNIFGTLMGAIIMSMLTSVLIFLNVPSYWQDVVIGSIIIVVVAFDVYRRQIRYVPARIKKVWDVSDTSERPDLELVMRGAGVSTDVMSTNHSENGRPVLELHGIDKRFGYVQALEGIDFELYAGEVLALVGDNGAGKSTLVKIASGAISPDNGEIFVRGKKITFAGPRDAMELGIAVLYQDLALVDCRNILSNLFLGREPTRLGGLLVDSKRMEDGSKMMLNGLRINIPSVKTPVQYLSGGQRQGVAIGRAISQGAMIIFLDEPTAALGVRESRQVLTLIEELKKAGCSVVVISHNLAHVFSIADRILVLRGGRKMGLWRKEDTTPEGIVTAITGAKVLEAID